MVFRTVRGIGRPRNRAGRRLRGAPGWTPVLGLSPLLPRLASTPIAPFHPPALDPEPAARTLAAGWAAVARGLLFED